MAVRTTVTSTINVPIYAGWRCSKCDAANFSKGWISYAASATSSAFFPEDREERAGAESKRMLKENWLPVSLAVITTPRIYCQEFRRYLKLDRYKCEKCGKKERWKKSMAYEPLGKFMNWCILFAVLFVLGLPKDPRCWAALLFFAGIRIACAYSVKHYRETMKKIPSRNMVKLGSLEPKLTTHAQQLGVHLLTPEEIVSTVLYSTDEVTENC